jgi:hypothetical protein
MYPNLAIECFEAVCIDSGTRWKDEVWNMVEKWQYCGHSRTAAVAKPNNDLKVVHLMLSKWFSELHST